jgi:two-component system, cell cycle response regulator
VKDVRAANLADRRPCGNSQLSAILRINHAHRSEPAVKLLLVEDEPTQQLLMERLLSKVGYAVEVASNGADALVMIKTGKYQLVLTDWEMPGMDGVTLCRLVRELNLPSVYILLLTSHGAAAHAVEGLRAGANDFIRKPADETELVARLDAGRRVVLLEQSLRDANTQIERLSVTDSLLGIFNRRYLHERLPQEAARARSCGQSVSVVMADLDHFKQINDTFGHAAGDACLAGIIPPIQAELRQSDVIGRYGGEEFVVILYGADAAAAYPIAERICRRVSDIRIEGFGAAVQLTCSIGVAASDTLEVWGQHLIAHADTAVYAAKRSGRNQVQVAATLAA